MIMSPDPNAGPFRSLLVHVDSDYGTTSRIRLAANLAGSYDASLIGAAACEEIYRSDGEVWLPMKSDDPTYGEETRIETQLSEAEALFRKHAGNRRIQWRGGYGDKTTHLLEHSAAADLIVVGRHETSDALEDGSILSVADLVLKAGRPVLVVPPDVEELLPFQVLIGWTDTREARRAVLDSLPFLRKAQVLIVNFQTDDESCDFTGITDFMQAHDVSWSTIQHDRNDDPALALMQIAREGDFGLLVAGAYGHGPLRENLFGGMTRSLIESTPVPCLLSN